MPGHLGRCICAIHRHSIVDIEQLLRSRGETLRTTPCHILNSQFGTDMVEQEIPLPIVNVQRDIMLRDQGWQDGVRRWYHRWRTQERAQNRRVASTVGTPAANVQCSLDIGATEVLGHQGQAVDCATVVVDVIDVEARNSCAIGGSGVDIVHRGRVCGTRTVAS